MRTAGSRCITRSFREFRQRERTLTHPDPGAGGHDAGKRSASRGELTAKHGGRGLELELVGRAALLPPIRMKHERGRGSGEDATVDGREITRETFRTYRGRNLAGHVLASLERYQTETNADVNHAAGQDLPSSRTTEASLPEDPRHVFGAETEEHRPIEHHLLCLRGVHGLRSRLRCRCLSSLHWHNPW